MILNNEIIYINDTKNLIMVKTNQIIIVTSCYNFVIDVMIGYRIKNGNWNRERRSGPCENDKRVSLAENLILK